MHYPTQDSYKPVFAALKLAGKLKKAGQLMEIPVLDHVIISENGYFSTADSGLI